MSPLPLHPAIVHVPIGVALVLPVVAGALAVAIGRGLFPQRAWLVVVLLEALALGGGLAAARTGEDDRRETVMTVGSATLDPHEADGHAFNRWAGLALGLGAAGLLPGPALAGHAVRAAGVVATLVSAYAAYRAGHGGGELVYRYGAASVYVPEKKQ